MHGPRSECTPRGMRGRCGALRSRRGWPPRGKFKGFKGRTVPNPSPSQERTRALAPRPRLRPWLPWQRAAQRGAARAAAIGGAHASAARGLTTRIGHNIGLTSDRKHRSAFHTHVHQEDYAARRVRSGAGLEQARDTVKTDGYSCRCKMMPKSVHGAAGSTQTARRRDQCRPAVEEGVKEGVEEGVPTAPRWSAAAPAPRWPPVPDRGPAAEPPAFTPARPRRKMTGQHRWTTRMYKEHAVGGRTRGTTLRVTRPRRPRPCRTGGGRTAWCTKHAGGRARGGDEWKRGRGEGGADPPHCADDHAAKPGREPAREHGEPWLGPQEQPPQHGYHADPRAFPSCPVCCFRTPLSETFRKKAI